MDSNSQNPSAQARSADAGSGHADLGRDPPPRPLSNLDTPDEEARLDRDVGAWLDRNGNGDYVRSWDPRFLRQMPLLSRLWGYDEEWFRERLFSETLHLTRMAGRRLSLPELSIYGMHASKGIVAASYDRPLTFGVTAFFLWRGAATFRMPFYQPQFVRFTHPQLTKRPFFSIVAWHGTRIGAYGAVGYAAYFFLAERYRRYMTDSFAQEGLKFELVLKTLVDDMQVNLDAFERDQQTRRRLSEQSD